jgi:hypothetical protein
MAREVTIRARRDQLACFLAAWEVNLRPGAADESGRVGDAGCRFGVIPFVYSMARGAVERPRRTHNPMMENDMRFMVMVRATKDSEAGVMPDEKLLADMGRFNEELVKAGIMLAGEGLQPSSKGARVRYSGSRRTVIDGPFAETKELIAGYWMWQCKSLDEAIEWAKRCPNPFPDQDSEVEIRQVFEAEDFGEEFTPELREQEERVRAQANELAKGRK